MYIERKDTTCHIMSRKIKIFEENLLLIFQSFKVFQNGLKPIASILWAFFRPTGLLELSPLKSVQILLQIQNPVTNSNILAPELVVV